MKIVASMLPLMMFFSMSFLFGYTEGTVHVADISIKPDLKNVTYYKVKKVEFSGVTYRWVLLTPQEIGMILQLLQNSKIDPTTRIDDALINRLTQGQRESKLFALVLGDFKGRKMRRIIKVLRKEKPGLIDKLATVLPDVGSY
jgi:hypothetical protein